MPFYLGYHQKLQPRVRVGLPTLNYPLKEIPHRCACLLGSQLIAGVVELTTKACRHMSRAGVPVPCESGDTEVSARNKLNTHVFLLALLL